MRCPARALAAGALFAFIAGAACSFAAQEAAAPPARSREELVLDVLRKLPVRHVSLSSTPLVAVKNSYGCTVIAPGLLGLCGTGWEQAFEPELARQLARELAAIYGWMVAGPARAPHGIDAELDACDAERKLALELRGRVEHAAIAGAEPGWPRLADEEPARDLALEEARDLVSHGWRLHVADGSSFWIAHSGDAFSTVFAYLASVIAFLNETSDGEDVPVEALRASRALWFPYPAFPATKGVAREPFEGGSVLRVSATCEIALRFDPLRAEIASGELAADPLQRFRAPRTRVAKPLSTRGRPTQIHAFGLDASSGAIALALVQADDEGTERELARSASTVLFVPSRFDPARPFVLKLRLEPGEHRLEHGIWIAAPEDLVEGSKPATNR